MDGVVLDTEMLFKQASFEVAKSLGFKMSEEIYIKTVGTPSDVARRIICDGMGGKFPFAKFDKLWTIWIQKRLESEVPTKPFAKEILQYLRKENIPLAIATSSSRKSASNHLGKANLLDYFETIITSDDIINGKPHPEPFLKAANSLGIEPNQCLAIEDSYNGIRSANSAGMKAIMIPDLLPPTNAIEALCHLILPSMQDLHQIIMQSK